MSIDKQQILETITTISKLISLSFKPIGTKISIRDHKLVLCETNKTDTFFAIPFSQQSLGLCSLGLPLDTLRFLYPDFEESINDNERTVIPVDNVSFQKRLNSIAVQDNPGLRSFS